MSVPARVSGPRPVRTRLKLTRENVVERGAIDDVTVDEAARLRAVFDYQRRESTQLAELYDQLAPLAEGAAAPARDPEDRHLFLHAVCIAFRATTGQGEKLLHDASLTVEYFPRIHARLREGVLPVAWHRRILRAAETMDPDQRAALDEHLSCWDLEHLSVERFCTELRYLAAWIRVHIGAPEPESQQSSDDVELPVHTDADGRGCLYVTAPFHELRSFTHRLDGTARAVQAAQKAALEHGGPIPHDPDGEVLRTGRPLSLARLRTRLLVTAQFTTEGVDVPKDRFHINVTVPVLSLLGVSDAPGLVEGQAPIPARLARSLAAQCPDWQRILTDPATGTFLPLAARRYVPTTAMREHLRLLHSTCAAPGCTRSTLRGTEADHITPYNHETPESGGQTAIENLHLLCRWHHQRKTARDIRPTRDLGAVAPPASASPMKPGTSHPVATAWAVGPPHATIHTTTLADRDPGTVYSLRDLPTPHTADPPRDSTGPAETGTDPPPP